MGKKLLLGTVAGLALGLGVSAAQAADIEPIAESPAWYVTLFGGVTWMEDFDTEYSYSSSGNYTAAVETDTGFIVGGAVGTHLTDDLRVEVEAAYSENDADQFDFDDGGSYDIHGDIGVLTFMANLWYDMPLSEEFKPYIGGGAGIAIVDGKIAYEPDDGDDTIFDSSEVTFAFQVGGGLRWALTDRIALDVGYRLKGIDGPDFGGSDFSGSSKYHADWIWSHNVIGGVSFGF